MFDIEMSDSTLSIVGSDRVLSRIDDGTPGELGGAWLLSGRVKKGVTIKKDVDRSRRVMKILSGTRYQWIAYNTTTNEFMGSGGGRYTSIDGKYKETMEFMYMDVTRIGMSLNYNYRLLDGNWHHTGFSNKGAPTHEIWSVRE